MNSSIKCDVCLRDYKNRSNYDKHIRMNRCKVRIPNDVNCSYCNKMFSTKYNKIRHENKCHQSHSNEIQLLKEELKSIRNEIKTSNKNNTNISFGVLLMSLDYDIGQNNLDTDCVCVFDEQKI